MGKKIVCRFLAKNFYGEMMNGFAYQKSEMK